MKLLLNLLMIVMLSGCGLAISKTSSSIKDNGLSQKKRLEIMSNKAIADLAKIPFDSLNIPRTLEENGTLKGTPSKSWTSGFYPGMLWQLYGFSKNEKLKDAAIKWQNLVEKEKFDGGTHDLGFKIFCPFGNAYKTTNDPKYKEVILTASKTLSSRYSPKIGAIRSWDHHADIWGFPVIIDNMMNLEMLFEATKLSGDSSFYYIAKQHAFTTLENHFRSDNSSYHVVDYDTLTGEVVNKHTHQGAHHESAWSRGQAWGLYGYAVAYRYTKEEAFLQQAIKIATFIFNHPNLPKDLIPYWDYNAPNIPNEPRDVSAAVIAASGLLELSIHDQENKSQYVRWVDEILNNLESNRNESNKAPFFLQHSVGNFPRGSEIDAPIIYADYFYVETLIKRLAHNDE